MKISIIIPMFNEAEIIADTAKRLHEYLSANYENYQVIFVDDGSGDNCADIVRKLNYPNISVISYEKNQGKGYAVRTGMLSADGDLRMFTDADLAYGVEVIDKAVKVFEEKHPDLIVGSRNLDKNGYKQYTLLRRIVSKVYIMVLNIAGGLTLSDSQCGCKAYSGKAAEKIFSRCEVNRFAFDFETLLWAKKYKMTVEEMPVSVLYHHASSVHIVRDSLRMLRDLHLMKKRIKKEKTE